MEFAETGNAISNDPSFKECHGRFTMVPFYPFSFKNG